MKFTLKNTLNKDVGSVELSDEVFGTPQNTALIYENVKRHLANKRSGTAATRNHCLVSGTTAKMYKQKGTGRARHGDYRTNIFVGGGKAFGPHPRDYSYDMPKKARKGGLRAALSIKAAGGKLLVLEDFAADKISTKEALLKLKNLGVVSGLIVVNGRDEKLEKSVRNIKNVKLVRSDSVNVYDVMKYEHTVIVKDALTRLQEVLRP